MLGMTNSGGAAAYNAKQALKKGEEAKAAAETGGGGVVDEGSSVAFSIDCDEKGVYIVTPDENEGGTE